MSEIKRCPFCGGEIRIAQKDFGLYYGYCVNRCFKSYSKNIKADLVEKLNTRKPMQDIVERLEVYPHGNYIDDYGQGFSVAMNIAIDLVKEVGGMND